jgi:rhodanese-related sulfurtransferase
LALAVLLAGGVCLAGCAPGDGGDGDGSGALSAVTVLTPGEARELIEREGDLFVLSVCHKWEFDYYRIPGSAMVPHHLLADWLAGESIYEEINRNRRPGKDQPVLLYCSTGGRTKKASALMARKGYERVYVLGGGMRDWMRAGIPYEKTTLSGSASPEEKQGISDAAGENGSGEG